MPLLSGDFVSYGGRSIICCDDFTSKIHTTEPDTESRRDREC